MFFENILLACPVAVLQSTPRALLSPSVSTLTVEMAEIGVLKSSDNTTFLFPMRTAKG
jgi:hypothetical protein